MHVTYRILALAIAMPATVAAQSRATPPTAVSVSLADAVRLAERESEAVRAARAGVDRARGQQLQARSQRYPQLTGSASYQRAIQLQFEEITKRLGDGNGDSGNDNGSSFADSPLARVFASPNTMVLGLSASQLLYSGGRVDDGIASAAAGVRAADIGVRSATAQVVLEVAAAYFDAQVADRLLAIADSSFAQTERALAQTQLARDVGNAAEYDLIRARVQRDNVRPSVITARTQREVAYLRLRQLLNLAPDQSVTLTTPVESAAGSAVGEARTASALVGVTPAGPDTTSADRAIVRQAAEQVRAQEALLQAARAQRLPAVSLTSSYQRFAYPPEGSLLEDQWKLYFPNWTVSLGVSVPLFTGWRQRGEQDVAEANLVEARERYEQARESAALDARLAYARLEQAEALYAASAGTDEQAARAYAIAEVRHAEGIATQLELTQARVDLQTARANRARAARDAAMARLTVALLNDLPIGAATAGQ